tara:strand:- start:1322 stop:2398 length:1077 start_codon:yes stop_codon:yes gene_type:complete
MILSLAIIFFSAYLIWKSSESFDIASSYLTRNLNDGIKGPTINAIASSLPELLISFIFLFYIGDIEGFSAGYAVIIGSSIFNIAIIPTISFFIIFYREGIPLFPTDKNIIQQDGLLLIITEIALLMGLYFGGISIYLASILIILYLIYIILIFKKRNATSLDCKSKKDYRINFENTTFINNILNINVAGLILNKSKINTWKAILILIISLSVISFACKELATNSEHLSKQLNLNLFFITFFIAAVSSSLPDTILSIKDAKNKKYKDAFSNAYGSNIFDICIGIGLPVLIYLLVNDLDSISTNSANSNNNIILISSFLLILFSVPITLIYWFKDLNFKRSLLIISFYFCFLGIIYFLSL